MFFVGDVISGIGFGQGYQALGPNPKRKVFCTSFQLKLG